MTAHLLESTLLLAIAVAARTRYAIVFLALLKFAIPWKPHVPHGTIAISIAAPIPAARWPRRSTARCRRPNENRRCCLWPLSPLAGRGWPKAG